MLENSLTYGKTLYTGERILSVNEGHAVAGSGCFDGMPEYNSCNGTRRRMTCAEGFRNHVGTARLNPDFDGPHQDNTVIH